MAQAAQPPWCGAASGAVLGGSARSLGADTALDEAGAADVLLAGGVLLAPGTDGSGPARPTALALSGFALELEPGPLAADALTAALG